MDDETSLGRRQEVPIQINSGNEASTGTLRPEMGGIKHKYCVCISKTASYAGMSY